jgi:hypothetical protein
MSKSTILYIVMLHHKTFNFYFNFITVIREVQIKQVTYTHGINSACVWGHDWRNRNAFFTIYVLYVHF